MESLFKLTDLLKASGWQLFGVALVCLTLWRLGSTGHIPGLEGVWLLGLLATGGVCAGLSLGALLVAIQNGLVSAWGHANLRRRRIHFQKQFLDDAPYLDEHSAKILGYLRHYQMKHFDVADDGGYAATLLGAGYIVLNARPSQRLNPSRVPVMVHEAIWPVLLAHPEVFPHRPEYSSEPQRGDRVEMHPWRIPWKLQ